MPGLFCGTFSCDKAELAMESSGGAAEAQAELKALEASAGAAQ